MCWLREEGHDAVLTSAEQLHAVRDLDLIVVDVADPRAAAEQVRALRAVCPVPVLVASGRLRRHPGPSPGLARQLGASAVLAKPYTREQLLAAIAAALSGAG